jgi:hypothetical protein
MVQNVFVRILLGATVLERGDKGLFFLSVTRDWKIRPGIFDKSVLKLIADEFNPDLVDRCVSLWDDRKSQNIRRIWV